jgi:hypothetical protein
MLAESDEPATDRTWEDVTEMTHENKSYGPVQERRPDVQNNDEQFRCFSPS